MNHLPDNAYKIRMSSEADYLKQQQLRDHQKQINCIISYALLTIFCLVCIIFILVFFICPVIFASSIELQRLLMFTNMGLTKNPTDFETVPRHPYMLVNNFYLTFQDIFNETITLGVWHLLPLKLYPNVTNQTSELDFDKLLASNVADVVIHFHGSGETRRDSNMMYKVLIGFFHVIAFDYRDYGDSTAATLSEKAIATDAIHIFEWVKKKTNRSIYVWGHSLGTPLSTLTIDYLPNHLKPHGLILEAPFTSMHEEIPVHPYGKIFAWLPWFEQTVQTPLEMNGLLFNTSDYILKVDCPILILHAEDDSIIPYTLGRKLAEIATKNRSSTQGSVIYVQFPAILGFDHFSIYKSPKLPMIISNFTQACDNFYNMTHTL